MKFKTKSSKQFYDWFVYKDLYKGDASDYKHLTAKAKKTWMKDWLQDPFLYSIQPTHLSDEDLIKASKYQNLVPKIFKQPVKYRVINRAPV